MEHDIEHPVQAVFDMPVAPHDVGEQLDVERQGGQIVMPLQAGTAISLDLGLDDGDRAGPGSGARREFAGRS